MVNLTEADALQQCKLSVMLAHDRNTFPAVRFTDYLVSAAHEFRYQNKDRNNWIDASLMD